MLNGIIKEAQEESRNKFISGFTSDGEILVDEEGTQTPIWIMHFIDTLITSTAQAAHEAGKKEERERIREAVSYLQVPSNFQDRHPIAAGDFSAKHGYGQALIDVQDVLNQSELDTTLSANTDGHE